MERATATGRKGFTLLELMIVLTVIAVLVGIAIPILAPVMKRARETALKDDLRSFRIVIDQYTADKKKAPSSLQDLIDAGYLRELPMDPFTESRDTWQPVMGNSVISADQTQPGIEDVHSGSSQISSENTPYSTW
jgi:general secretion pathway protein G